MASRANRGVSISVKGDVKQVTKYLTKIEKKIIPKAASQSLNRARQRVQTMVVRSLSKRLKIKAKIIRPKVAFKAAKPDLLITEIWGWWGGVPVIRLGAARETKKGVTVAGRKIDRGFIQRSKWGRDEVLRRTGASRLPVPRQVVPIEEEGDRITRVHIKRHGARLFLAEFNRQLARKLR